MKRIRKITTKGSLLGLLVSVVSLFSLAMPVEAGNSRTVSVSIDEVTISTFVISYGYDWQAARAYRVIVRDTTTGDVCSLLDYPAYSTYEYLLNGTTLVGFLDVPRQDISAYLCHTPDPTHAYSIQFDVWQVGKNGKVRLLAEQLDYWTPSP